MSLDNFCEESDKSNHHRWRIAATMILAGILFALTTHFCQQDNSPEAIEERVYQSGGLQTVDRLCRELPKPEGFQFAYKDITGNTLTYAVSFAYTSEKSSKEVKQFYSDWFSNNGWQLDEDGSGSYRKNKQIVAIAYMGGEKANYSIYCGEEH